MLRIVRLLCGFAVALVVAAVCFGSLVNLASAAETPLVHQADDGQPGSGLDLILRNVYSPDIASPLVLRPNDRLVEVRGGIACTVGERYRVRVVVSQNTTGALAEGHTQGFCTGANQIFTLLAVARGSTKFETGTARAEAFAITFLHGQPTDRHTWWRDVSLERDE
jgi:uncharacterized protein (DUF433 family)